VAGWQDPDATPVADVAAAVRAYREAPPTPLEPAEVEHEAIVWLLACEGLVPGLRPEGGPARGGMTIGLGNSPSRPACGPGCRTPQG
jgi:hypothetical protein